MKVSPAPSMLLTVDNGNTSPHVGKFVDGHLEGVYPLSEISRLIPAPPEARSFAWVISQVGPERPELGPYLHLKKDLLKYKKPGQFFDMPFAYTPGLGDDRLFQAYSLYQDLLTKKRHPKEQGLGTLLIDAGTFLTVDLVTSQGLLGGLIFPGPQTLLKAYGRGAQLPQLSTQNWVLKATPELPAHSTEEAIRGASQALLRGALKEVLATWKWDQLVLTGGGASLILAFLRQWQEGSPENAAKIIKVETHFIHHSMARLFDQACALEEESL